jgi:uncharacterized protein (DUF1015 family)
VIGALRLEKLGTDILPHERTLARPLGDRLQLLRACPVNLSPIYLLSPAAGLSLLLEPEGPPRAAVTDPLGVHHRLYDISSSGRIRTITDAIASHPLVIADGHHRYETALAFRDEIAGRLPGAECLMALIVELSSDQLEVQPIHRVLWGPPPEGLEGTPVDGDLAAIARDKVSIVVASEPGRGTLLEPPPSDMTPAVYLHERVLAGQSLEYESGAERIAHALANGATVFFLPPVTVEEIGAMTRRGERFPEKTTFFFPKPRTGLVFRSLSES